MVYIAYYAELNLQICNYVQKRRIHIHENNKFAPDEIFFGHFWPRQKAANFCHPGLGCNHPLNSHSSYFPNPLTFGKKITACLLYSWTDNETTFYTWSWFDILTYSTFSKPSLPGMPMLRNININHITFTIFTTLSSLVLWMVF